jgi:hypothetical protein
MGAIWSGLTRSRNTVGGMQTQANESNWVDGDQTNRWRKTAIELIDLLGGF